MTAQTDVLAPDMPSRLSRHFRPWCDFAYDNFKAAAPVVRDNAIFVSPSGDPGNDGQSATSPIDLATALAAIPSIDESTMVLFEGGARFRLTDSIVFAQDHCTLASYGDGMAVLTGMLDLSAAVFVASGNHYTTALTTQAHLVHAIGYEFQPFHRCTSSAEVESFGAGSTAFKSNVSGAFYWAANVLYVALNPAYFGGETDPNEIVSLLECGNRAVGGIEMTGHGQRCDMLNVQGFGVIAHSASIPQAYPIRMNCLEDQLQVVTRCIGLHGDTHGISSYANATTHGLAVIGETICGGTTRTATTPFVNNFFATNGNVEAFVYKPRTILGRMHDSNIMPIAGPALRSGAIVRGHVVGSPATPLRRMIVVEPIADDVPGNVSRDAEFDENVLSAAATPDDCKMIVYGGDVRATQQKSDRASFKALQGHLVLNPRHRYRLDNSNGGATGGSSLRGFMYNFIVELDLVDCLNGFVNLTEAGQQSVVNTGKAINGVIISRRSSGQLLWDRPGVADSPDPAQIINTLIIETDRVTGVKSYGAWPGGSNLIHCVLANRLGTDTMTTGVNLQEISGADYDADNPPVPHEDGPWAELWKTGAVLDPTLAIEYDINGDVRDLVKPSIGPVEGYVPPGGGLRARPSRARLSR